MQSVRLSQIASIRKDIRVLCKPESVNLSSKSIYFELKRAREIAHKAFETAWSSITYLSFNNEAMLAFNLLFLP